MPTCLPSFRPVPRKKFKLFALLLLSPLLFHAQSLTGLWTGALSNDSNSVRKDQGFEIALTEYKGKVYGYSRSEFIVDDTLYYVVKRVKGIIEGDVCEVTDDEIIAYNFRGKLDKGVKVTSTFKRNKGDSTWYLAGTWKTNATKKYYSVTGKVALEEEKDLTASKIFPHLEELKLANDIAFYKERQEGQPIVKIAKPERINPLSAAKNASFDADVSLKTKDPSLQRAEATIPEPEPVVVKRSETVLPKTETNSIDGAGIAIKPAVANTTQTVNIIPEETAVAVKKTSDELPRTGTNAVSGSSVSLNPSAVNRSVAKNTVPQTGTGTTAPTDAPVNNKPVVAQNNKAINTPPTTTSKQPDTKTIVKNNPPVNNNPAKTNTEIKKQDIAAVNNTPKTTSVASAVQPGTKEAEPVIVKTVPEVKKPEVDVTSKVAMVGGRKSEFSQVVNFKSDSLVLSLYDNGEIDGDTVSVLLNGEVLLSHQGLKASAIKKTIYIKPGEEDFSLVLFADNLGKYPPNTGLLVVRDGDDVYNLRFSSDFEKNAGIVFRKKR